MAAKKFLNTLCAIAIISSLTSCAKTTYDGSARLKEMGGITTPPAPQASQNDNSRPGRGGDNIVQPVGDLPVVSFTETYVAMNQKYSAQLELQLSRASKVPVVVIVDLLDGATTPRAMHGRDYNGFVGKGFERSQTVVFAPGELTKKLSKINGRDRDMGESGCNGTFTAAIQARHLKDARVLNPTATILVPCSAKVSGPNRPPRVPELPPTLPCPPDQQPPAKLPVARFEKPKYQFTASNSASVRIVLDTMAEQPVCIQWETRQGMKQDATSYVPTRDTKCIQKGQSSLEIAIPLLCKDVCNQTPSAATLAMTSDFQVVITSISNATPENTSTAVEGYEDLTKCPVAAPPTAPVAPPAVAPVPVAPAPAPVITEPKIVNVYHDSNALEVSEADSEVTLKVLLDEPSTLPVKVNLYTDDSDAMSSVDYEVLATELDFAPGEISKLVKVPLVKRDKCGPNASKASRQFFVKFGEDIINARIKNSKVVTITIKPGSEECVAKP